MQDIATLLAEVISLVENRVAIGGHVRSEPVVLAGYQTWDASYARADQVRELMQLSGLTPDRFQRVTGFGDQSPTSQNPMAVRNNRIEVVLLRSDIQ